MPSALRHTHLVLMRTNLSAATARMVPIGVATFRIVPPAGVPALAYNINAVTWQSAAAADLAVALTLHAQCMHSLSWRRHTVSVTRAGHGSCLPNTEAPHSACCPSRPTTCRYSAPGISPSSSCVANVAPFPRKLADAWHGNSLLSHTITTLVLQRTSCAGDEVKM